MGVYGGAGTTIERGDLGQQVLPDSNDMLNGLAGFGMAPRVSVAERVGRFTKFDWANLAALGIDDLRASGQYPNEALLTSTQDTWITQSRALSVPLDLKDIAAAGNDASKTEANTVGTIRRQLYLTSEARVVVAADAGTQTAARTAAWSAATGTAIRADINAGRQAIIDASYSAAVRWGCAMDYKLRDALLAQSELTDLLGGNTSFGADGAGIGMVERFLMGMNFDEVVISETGQLTSGTFYMFAIDNGNDLANYRGALASVEWTKGAINQTTDFRGVRHLDHGFELQEKLIHDVLLYRVTNCLA